MMRRWGRHTNAPNQGATMVGISLDAAWRPPVPKGMRGRPPPVLASPFLSQDFCHHPNVSNLGEKRRGDRYSEVVNPAKGYGFIQPANGGKDVFVHISAVEKAGLSGLNEGATVSYEIVANRGKDSAENLRVG